MTQRPHSNKHLKNPSLTRFPLPFTGNRVGVPPPSPFPPYSHIPATLHSRPISQPVEEPRYSPSLPPSPFTMYHPSENHLPPRKSHRRSNSDVSFAMMPQTLNSPIPAKSLDRSISSSDWSSLVKEEPRQSESDSMDDIITGYINLDNIDVLNSLGKTEVESSDNVNGLKRRFGGGGGGGDIAPTSSHYRSVSMDSCFIPKLNSGEAKSNAAYRFEYGNTEFSAVEMKRISADVKLAEIVMSDPKRVKRILANRLSAARSSERQTQYMAMLEHKVQNLQNETTLFSAQLTHLQRYSMGLQNENSELKFRLQAMEQQAQLRNAVSEKLTEEIQRLSHVIGDPTRSESKTSLNPEMFQQQLRISQFQQQQHSNQNSTRKSYHASNE